MLRAADFETSSAQVVCAGWSKGWVEGQSDGSLSRSYPLTPVGPEAGPYLETRRLISSSMCTVPSFRFGDAGNTPPGVSFWTRSQREEGAACAAVTGPFSSAAT